MPLLDQRTKNRPGLMRLTLLALLFAFTPLCADRILVIGDSSARPVVPELQTVLLENGHADISVDATPYRYMAKRMATPEGLSEISSWLDERPDVSVVQIHAGANDWVDSAWLPSWLGSQLEIDIITIIVKDVEKIVDHIQLHRPGIDILWPGYVFPRPMSRATPGQINTFLTTMDEQMAQFAMSKPGVSFVSLGGALQVAYGFDGIRHTSFDPSFIIPPGDPSLPDPRWPSPYGHFLPNEPWHPTPEAQKVLAQAQYDGFYASFLSGQGFHINAGLNDAWFDPATNGQGFFITVYPDIKQMYLAWFTYDTERPPGDVNAMLGDPGHRWMTALGPYDGDTANLTVYMTKGGVFDSPQPETTTDLAGDGSMVLEFADCNAGLVTYAITSIGQSGSIPIERVALDNLPLCESLNVPP